MAQSKFPESLSNPGTQIQKIPHRNDLRPTNPGNFLLRLISTLILHCVKKTIKTTHNNVFILTINNFEYILSYSMINTIQFEKLSQSRLSPYILAVEWNLYSASHFFLSICQLMLIKAVSIFWLLWVIILPWTSIVFVWIYISISLWNALRSRTVRLSDFIYFNC